MARTPITLEVGEAVRDSALGVPGVADLHRGRVGEVALLLPNARIDGLRQAYRDGERGIEIHIVFDTASRRDIQSVAADVRSAVLGASDLPFVDVVVADAQ
ncbi:hypothetical protein QP866_02085 [Corynebacterium imitans]|uniref:hypothetical protein n=1 Tax=Corynebacterium imitans TaxID=156978 RepID=UPI00254F51D5|nr:hypothetical protein [Corynebacterium imitans]MDK8305519.1 hypothetical protein [Corynebacterium imitans]MDK8636616.1 hypothetical protein [Corynebacterium imitans]MDK8771710.1 hypothetical protein [Corynebacterium imitans]